MPQDPNWSFQPRWWPWWPMEATGLQFLNWRLLRQLLAIPKWKNFSICFLLSVFDGIWYWMCCTNCHSNPTTLTKCQWLTPLWYSIHKGNPVQTLPLMYGLPTPTQQIHEQKIDWKQLNACFSTIKLLPTKKLLFKSYHAKTKSSQKTHTGAGLWWVWAKPWWLAGVQASKFLVWVGSVCLTADEGRLS